MTAADDAAVLIRVNDRQEQLEAITRCPECDRAGWYNGHRCKHQTKGQHMTDNPPMDRDMAQKAFQHFVTLKPPKWRVECPPKTWPDDKIITFTEAAKYNDWIVKSPRGVVVFRSESRTAALQIARSMAYIDELLARVNRLESHTFGTHPALKARASNRSGW